MLTDKITITDITVTKKGNYALFSNEKFLFSVSDKVLVDNDIHIGSALTQRQLDDIYNDSVISRCMQKSLFILSYGMHSRVDLRRKLSKDYENECIDTVVAKLTDMGYLDDEYYAQVRCEYLINNKHASLAFVRHDLASHGVDKQICDTVLQDFDTGSEIDAIIKQLSTKYATRLNDTDKVVQSLMRKGFLYEDIYRALEYFRQQEES